MDNIRSPSYKQYEIVKNDGLEQIMFVLRDTSVKKSEIPMSNVKFKKMIPLKGHQLSFLQTR